MKPVKLIECPRDAMQGWPHLIPTTAKVKYLQQLLQVGFDTLDCLSFVSPKAIPQMADSHEVARQLNLLDTQTKLLAIVANERGSQDALQYNSIHYLGYPFSISPTFQMRNANSTIDESWQRVLAIRDKCVQGAKELVVYISMGFGNPYGDAYSEALVTEWVGKLQTEGIRIVSLADTVGIASADLVQRVTQSVVAAFPALEIGVHLHSTAQNRLEKLEAAWKAGCSRFDGALKGYGGCPMAGNDLVGNLDTAWMIDYFGKKEMLPGLNMPALHESIEMSTSVFV